MALSNEVVASSHRQQSPYRDLARAFISGFAEERLSRHLIAWDIIDELTQRTPLLKAVMSHNQAWTFVTTTPDLTLPQAFEALVDFMPDPPRREARRFLKSWQIQTQRQKIVKPNEPPVEKTIQPNKPTLENPPRRVVIEKGTVSVLINDPDQLRREIKRANSELTPDEILEIIGYLTTADVNELRERYTARINGGPFDLFQELKRRGQGRVLFRVFDDQDPSLRRVHVRLGRHSRIHLSRSRNVDR